MYRLQLILDVRGQHNIDFYHDYREDIPEILKKWCDAEPDDRVSGYSLVHEQRLKFRRYPGETNI